MLKFPLSARELEPWMPHRPPMLWVDEVVELQPKKSICRTLISPSRPFFDSHGFRPSVSMELIAQSYGLAGIAERLIKGKGKLEAVHQAFLAAITQAEILGSPEVEEWVTIETSTTREFGPLILFQGQVIGKNGNLIATAQLKAFHQ